MKTARTFKDRLNNLVFGDYMILLPTIILVALLTGFAPNFMTYSNWMNLLRQVSLIAILAAGMFFPMLTGCIDLGLGSVVGITGIVFAILDFPPSAAVGVPTVNGFIETVKAHGGIEIVAQQDGKASRVDSMAAMENILTANPDLDIVFAFNLDMTIGAANAIEAAGSDCVAVGGGWGEEGFTMLENGHPIIKALVSSSPVTQAKDAIDAIAKLMAGEELPDETLSHGTLLTQETIKDFDWRSVVEARG